MHLTTPEDTAYDEARAVWNGRFDSRPSVIAHVTSAREAAEALAVAKRANLSVTVRGGGHDYTGRSACEGGLLIDLGSLDSVSVDPEARRATVGAGARWADVDRATQAHGLATPGGTVSSVGVAGFTLGGGQGWLTRTHGLACDNLVAAEVVTASGEILRASETEHPDLLWGLRGGGGSLGIVTSLEYALHPLDHEVLAGQVIYPLERADELLGFYRDFFEDAPDTVMCFPFFYRVPPLDLFPAASHGQIVLAFVVACFAPVDEGERALAPFRGLGDPVLDGVFPQSYVALQQAFDAGMSESGNRWYSRAHKLRDLGDDCIDTIVESIDPLRGDFTSVYLTPGGGVAGRRPVDETAYPHRGAAHQLHIFPGWTDPEADEGVMAWTREFSERVEPFSHAGVYVNMLAEDEEHRVAASYGPNYDRLAQLMAEWDPDGVFRSTHNIPPRR